MVKASKNHSSFSTLFDAFLTLRAIAGDAEAAAVGSVGSVLAVTGLGDQILWAYILVQGPLLLWGTAIGIATKVVGRLLADRLHAGIALTRACIAAGHIDRNVIADLIRKGGWGLSHPALCLLRLVCCATSAAWRVRCSLCRNHPCTWCRGHLLEDIGGGAESRSSKVQSMFSPQTCRSVSVSTPLLGFIRPDTHAWRHSRSHSPAIGHRRLSFVNARKAARKLPDAVAIGLCGTLIFRHCGSPPSMDGRPSSSSLAVSAGGRATARQA